MIAARAWRGLVLPGVFSLALAAFCAGLGFWQLQRLEWKTELLARIGQRMALAPLPLPPEAVWPSLDAASDEYRRVRVSGVYENGRESYLFEGAGLAGAGRREPGWFVLTPLLLDDGSRVIVNRGFVPQTRRDPATRPEGQIAGRAEVVGVLRWPRARGPFAAADAPERREWMTRDPAAIAESLGLARVAPFIIDAERSQVPGGLPRGAGARLDIPNNHLSYAVTWFALAGTALVMFAAYAWSRRRRPA